MVVLRQKIAVEKHETFVCVNACFLRYAFEYLGMSIGAKAEGHACLSARSPFAVLFLLRIAIFVSHLSVYFVLLLHCRKKKHFFYQLHRQGDIELRRIVIHVVLNWVRDPV